MEDAPFASQQALSNPGNICHRCMLSETEDGSVLSEIAGSQNRNVEGLLGQMDQKMPALREKAGKFAEKRLEEERERLLEQAEMLRDDIREKIEQQINELEYQPQEEITSRAWKNVWKITSSKDIWTGTMEKSE